ncbi:MAG: RNA polymerase sigma-70 factor [Sphingobacteriales bacterium]|nr:RNA polymerase sigma-70 factor [Sphingobacteriales bacterium]
MNLKTPGLSDQQILNEIALGNQKVFDELYQKHYKNLFMLSFKYTRDQEITEEVVHDVFIKIWNQASSIIITQSLAGYLARAVVNTSINVIRKNKLINEHQEKYEVELFTDFEENQDEAMGLEQKLIQLEMAIEKLPSQCKKVLLMSKFQKLKQQEIADELDISIKTVKNHLTYAYKKLKENINGHLSMIILLIFELYRTFFYH